MRILLTNDDGIDAPGLAALEAAVPEGVETLVVAPDCQRSECGHSVTTRHEIAMEQRGPRRWAISGTPADCVRVALAVLQFPLDGVLSGVNDGGNLGADIYMSGTVAAAREAALHGVASVAISHYRRPDVSRSWDHVPAWLDGVLIPLLTSEHTPGTFWNVNLPAVESSVTPQRELTRLDPGPMTIGFERNGQRLKYRADYHGRHRNPGTDVDACFGGRISLTRLNLGR